MEEWCVRCMMDFAFKVARQGKADGLSFDSLRCMVHGALDFRDGVRGLHVVLVRLRDINGVKAASWLWSMLVR